MMDRRQFIGTAGSASLFLLAGGFASCMNKKTFGEFVFLEAEQFENHGGWDLDQQTMDQMGSPYLLAHGLGIPVEDARTKIVFPSSGKYRVWVRTRDWVAPWNVPGAPGKFQVLVNDTPLQETFGTKGAEWNWHDGGVVEVDNEAKVSLHDLTGFEGRCDSILFCKDLDFTPTNELEALTKFRRNLLGLSDTPEDGGSFDFAVIGGGFAGTCSALSAARNGLKVALIQDRPVLGGNGSSEVRVWPEGKIQQEPYPHIGDIVEEIAPDLADPKYGSRNAVHGAAYNDARKLEVVGNEPLITLFLDERAIQVETKDENITGVIIQNTKTAVYTKIKAKFFADCTGDATIGYLAGADYEMSSSEVMGMSNLWNVLDVSNQEELLKCECKDKTALAMSCEIGEVEQPFPRCPWAIDLSDKPFPGRKNYKGQWGAEDPLGNLGGWFWESGFDKNPITDVEKIRDLNFRAMYGAWDALKNVDKLYPNYRLGWSAFIAGKRESRRLMGDVVLDGDDFVKQTQFSDPAFPCSWEIDLHHPHESFDEGLQGQEFISKATIGEGYKHYEYKGIYWAPYRTLYSRNINNLFMAGRNISVTRKGLGPVRVMRTCGMMGEIVGKAASVCVRHKTTPRGVYTTYLDNLKSLMQS
ncbi:FAD-dependent oxidoreductase [Sabulilitoribacter arenilitoris]|uniref:FAD-dependent oxidoreductase n=1 Tax=Wocania arenilitoris TaxID=2044858 RepID=A0AAE3JNA2_9FLAO|nr:FAD-dependent oxidoreductase [Wocania arenilitoris]MCF7567055.1 FAD-dependent oxidoreductase [Wocania arenilitoris]